MTTRNVFIAGGTGYIGLKLIWPYALIPMYWLFERLPGTRETALRLGLVTLEEMVAALVQSVESPPSQVRVLEVPAIRSAASASNPGLAAARTRSG